MTTPESKYLNRLREEVMEEIQHNAENGNNLNKHLILFGKLLMVTGLIQQTSTLDEENNVLN